MRLIHGQLSTPPSGLTSIALKVDRLRLAKRRWRAVAEDGAEFGFDLDSPLRDGAVFFSTEALLYHIEQQPEPVIEIVCPHDPASAAKLGWILGNLHFPIEVIGGHLRICDDSAVRQMLEREFIAHQLAVAVFQPLSGAHSHGV